MRLAELPRAPVTAHDWRNPIDSLGTQDFGEVLLQVFAQLARVDICAAIDLEGPSATIIFANASFACTHVSAIPELSLLPVNADTCVVRLDSSILRSHGMSDGVVVQGRRGERSYGLALFRRNGGGTFSESEVDGISCASETWLSLLAKHERLLRADQSEDPSQALLSGDVPHLEDKLRRYMPSLSRSETRVCARILRGMSTPGIALDLNVQVDSVATYRKRAYRRLGIGTRLELIRLFIGACTSRPNPSAGRALQGAWN